MQTNWLILHVTSPLRSVEVKVHFMQLILKFKDNKRVLQCLLHANIVPKVNFYEKRILEPSQTFTVELFKKVVIGLKLLFIYAKSSIYLFFRALNAPQLII